MTVDRAALRALLTAGTPGVAQVRQVGECVMVWTEVGGYGRAVADCGDAELPQAWADAQLIAAAINALGPHLEQLDAAGEALRRARELVGQMADADGMDLNRLGMDAQDVLDAAIARLTTTTGGNP